MRRRLAMFWEKHEAWVVPIALAFFLGAGIQIGIKIGSAETALTCNAQISSKDEVIEGKDSRLRTLQDDKIEAKDQTIKVTQEAAVQAAEAARAAAEAAKAAAEAAATKPTKE